MTWGGAISGNWATGSSTLPTMPAKTMTTATTDAKIGRVMKKKIGRVMKKSTIYE